jgi:DNA-binding XRE family transcriptional regulator
MPKKSGALTPAQCRAARALLEWTQQELADHAQVSRATIRDFELGKHDAHRSTECLICSAFTAAGVTLVQDPILGDGAFLRSAAPPAPPSDVPESLVTARAGG